MILKSNHKGIPKRYHHIRDAVVAMRSYHNATCKTAISGSANNLYMVVTRVNRITAELWLNHRNKIIKEYCDQTGMQESHCGFCAMNKVNWLTMVSNWRRDEDIRIKKEIIDRETNNIDADNGESA